MHDESGQVAEILALRRSVAHQELLLSFHSALVTSKTNDELISNIHGQFQRFFQFSHCSLLLCNEERSTLRPYMIDPASKLRNHPLFSWIANHDFEINDGINNIVLGTTDPVLIRVSDHLDKENAPAYLPIIDESGLKEVLAISLHAETGAIGMLCFFSEDTDGFPAEIYPALQSAAPVIAKSVVSLQRYEEIRRRDEENRLILEISNAINSVREKNELLSIIKPKLQTAFSFSDICISCYDFKKGTYKVFVRDNAKTQQHPDWTKIEEAEFPIKDGMHNIAVAAKDPVIFDVESLTRMNQPHIDFILKAGIREVACVRLKNKNEIIGSLVLLSEEGRVFNAVQRNLLARLSHHVATAVSNIIANERIEMQLIEINRYKEQLEDEKYYLQEEAKASHSPNNMIGTGPQMQKVFNLVSQVSSSNTTVLLMGETGTGKELIARALHDNSGRHKKLMVKVNCAALPASLVESELFGHERGSFTGASERRIGKFELANHGTLFLDEIGEMPLEMQVKLLRAIQEREFERVGGRETIKVDVRLIAATNRDLQKEVQEGRFRSDLYYRLNVFPIVLPPLREHREDIPALARFFLTKYAKNVGRPINQITDEAMEDLMSYSWPGNVRELEHVIERSVLMATGSVLSEMHLPRIRTAEIEPNPVPDTIATFEENERKHIVDVLNICKGKIFGYGGAAEMLNLKVGTLNSKIKKLGISKSDLRFD